MNRPRARASIYLAALGAFFFLSYNGANAYASSLPHVPSLAFAWERHVPFLAWTILPYWSSDLLYALSFFLCRTREELDRLAARLLLIQLFSVACFVAFPLRVSFERPPLEGWTATLFDLLLSFDRPFNQAPSLHVGLAVILAAHYRHYAPRWLVALWFLLLALSPWTTYQHHFLDLPAGAWAGSLVLAAVPEHRWTESRRPRLAGAYLGAAVLLTALAFGLRGWAWLALWPGFSLSLVAAAYWTGDHSWISKRAVWMWPYTAGAWINSRLWTFGQPPCQELADGVWIGRAPLNPKPFRAVIDLTAELPIPATARIPILDLTVPRLDHLERAVAAIEHAARPVLVCCALGYSRSATVAAAWWMAHTRCGDPVAAREAVRRARPTVILRDAAVRRIEQWWEQRQR